METLIDVSGFDPNWLASPWYEWSDPQGAIVWAVQAMKMTTDGLQQQGKTEDDATWDDFTRQLDTTFGRSDWYTNAIVQRVLYAVAEVDRNNPLRLTDEQWLYAGTMARTALETWHQDTTDLLDLAAYLRVDPVQYGWVAPDFAEYVKYHISQGADLPDAATIGSWFAKTFTPTEIVSMYEKYLPGGVKMKEAAGVKAAKWRTLDDIGTFYHGQESPGEQDVDENFARYVRSHLTMRNGSLPTAAEIGSWFGTEFLPEAIVARFQTDFPQGVHTPNGTVLSIDDVGKFYLDAEIWAATNQLQDEELDPEFVKEILALFDSDEPLDKAGMAKVKEAIDAGVITFEDDD